jgi:hypothetical protein
VAVNEPGRYHVTVGIDFLAASLVDATNGSDDVALDPDISTKSGQARTVNDHSAPYHQVIGHRASFTCERDSDSLRQQRNPIRLDAGYAAWRAPVWLSDQDLLLGALRRRGRQAARQL